MTTWNPVNKNNTTLSSDLLTATPGSTAAGGVLAVYGRKTGKVQFEVTLVSSVANANELSPGFGLPVPPKKTAILGVGLASNSQSLSMVEYNGAFAGSNTEPYAADGAPLSFTGNGDTGAGPAIGSIFNWTIAANVPVVAGARVQLHYARPCNVYDIVNIHWNVESCTGWCGGVVQSYNPTTGAISVLITDAQPDLKGSQFEISFAVSVDGTQNGFTTGLDTTPAYTIFPYVSNAAANGNIAVDMQAGTKVVGFAIDYDAHTMQVNVGDGWYTQKSPLPADLLYPLFGTDMGSGISATINFGASAFTYAPPTGYVAYDSTPNPDPTLLPLRLTEEGLEVLRDAFGPVRMSTVGLAVLHNGGAAEVRCSTFGIEVLRSVINGNLIPRTHATIIG